MADTPPLVAGFLDRLGDRVRVTDRGTQVDVLRLRPELTAGPVFEAAVRRRMEQLSRFEHSGFARVLQVARLAPPDGRLVVISEAVDGWRLSEVLEATDRLRLPIQTSAVVFLLRQLVGAVSALHEVGSGISHGALGTERLVITPDCRLVVTESVFGGALRFLPTPSPDRVWRELRLALADGEAQLFGRLTDLRQVGAIALSLALGRQLRRDEPPSRLGALLNDLEQHRAERGADPWGRALHGWLARVLSLTGEETPWSVTEAQRELSRIVESDPAIASEPTHLTALLQKVADYYAADADADPLSVGQASRLPVEASRLPVEASRLPVEASRLPVEPSGEEASEIPACDVIDADLPSTVPDELPLVVTTAPLAPAPEVAPAPPTGLAPAPEVAPEPEIAIAPAPVVAPETPPAIAPAPVIPSVPPPAVAPSALQACEPPWLASRPSQHHTLVPEAASYPLREPTMSDRAIADAITPLAEAITFAPFGAAAAADADRARREPARPHGRPPERSMFGVDLSGDVPEAVSGRPPARRLGIWIGLGVAAIVVIAAGGYPLLWPKAEAAVGSSQPSSAAAPAADPAAVRTAGDAPAAAGPTASPSAVAPVVPVPPPVAAPADVPSGIVEIVSPILLDVSEGGGALGRSGQAIRLPVGRHTLDVAREDLGYRATHVVDVRQGRREQVRPSLPEGDANLNATPWAEVSVDGRSLGETPLGKLKLTIGSHEVTFRHPELGEQTRTLVVTTDGVARLSVDLRK